MTANNKPAALPPSEIEISNWRPYITETCRGFFTATLTSGMILRNLSLREKGNIRSISFPSKRFPGDDGQQHYSDYIGFVNDQVRNRFRDQILAALDRHFAALPIPTEQSHAPQQQF